MVYRIPAGNDIRFSVVHIEKTDLGTESDTVLTKRLRQARWRENRHDSAAGGILEKHVAAVRNTHPSSPGAPLCPAMAGSIGRRVKITGTPASREAVTISTR